MAVKKIVVYPRGYVGYDIGLPETGDKKEDFLLLIKTLTNANKIDKRLLDERSSLVSNPLVNKLWIAYSEKSSLLRSFEFREKLLLAALTAFGTNSFVEYIKLQKENPALTGTSIRFINDTLSFISGEARSINISSWVDLITMRSDLGSGRAPAIDIALLERLTRKDGGLSSESGVQLSGLEQVVRYWVCRPEGYKDLLTTLYILFGEIR